MNTEWEKTFGVVKRRCKPRNLEHTLQCRVIRWFRLTFPNMRHNLFAVPNGGYRTKTTAALMKAEGQLSGVADLILLKRKGKCGALLLEAKVKGNYQSDNQKLWQSLIEADGYEYRIFHTLEEFIEIVTEYLSRPDE
ncbi:MAG: VRR-NUC domain-containing protein [Alistipes sp.]|nr:VRR-NUC domain-containing protein [Alistipes sp.]